MIAADKGHDKICCLLMDHQADVNLQNEEGYSALIRAAMFGDVKTASVLLARGDADVGLKDSEGVTALHYACYAASEALVTMLLRSGADPTARDNNGVTPLHYAAERAAGPQVAAALLDAGADIDAVSILLLLRLFLSVS